MMDLNSTRSVLEGRAYPIIPYIDPPKTIVDCGGNAGATACYFAKLYPAANILSFEPSAYVFEFHRRNTRQFSNITGYNFGLSDCTGKVELLSGLESTVTQSMYSNSYTIQKSEEIEIKNAGLFLRGEGFKSIDVLKIDTQGAELPILRALEEFIPTTSVVYVEYHSEDDRIAIDRMLSPSHIITSGRTEVPHIGELCYVNKKYWRQGGLGHYMIGSK